MRFRLDSWHMRAVVFENDLSLGCIMTFTARKISILLLSAAAFSLSACATGGAAYEPIVDGPKDDIYVADLGECQKLAETREYLNSDTRTAAVVGAGVGGLVGLADAYDPNFEDFVGGAIIGALFGGGDRALKTRTERKYIVLDCMANRGHRVLG